MGVEGWALAAALAVWAAAGSPAPWAAAAGAAMGLVLGSPGVALGAMLAGLAVGEFQRREAQALARDRRDADAERLLHQLLAVAHPGVGIHRALDAVGVRRRAGEATLVDALARAHPAPALLQARAALEAVEHYGGSLAQLLATVAEQVRRDRRLRWDREAALAASRATLLILSLAPWAVVLVFRVMLPTFYAVIAGTTVGSVLLVWCGASAWALQYVGGRGDADA